MRDDPVVTDLMTRARNGDKQAWDALVERYAPLMWSIGILDARPRGSRPPWPDAPAVDVRRRSMCSLRGMAAMF